MATGSRIKALNFDKAFKLLASLTMPTVLLVGIVGCAFLYYFHPSDVWWMPRCPFLALTGCKCPGCGTLRAIHHLLHFRFSMAWSMNPLLIVVMPLLVALLVWPKLRGNVAVSIVVTVGIILYWLLRNIVGW